VAAGFRLLGLFGLLLALSSCLGSSEEIFATDQAVNVPGVEGDYVQQGGGSGDTLRLERISGSPDYAFFDPKNPDQDRMRLRAVSAGADMYLLQIRDDTWPAGRYWHVLVRVERANNAVARIVLLFPGEAALNTLAAQSGITFGPPGPSDTYGPNTMQGSREAIAAFLKKIPTLPLQEIGTYAKS